MTARGIAGLIILFAVGTARAEVPVAALKETEFVFIARVTKTEGVVFPEVSSQVRLAEATVEELVTKPEAAVLGPKQNVFVAFREPFPEVGARLRVYGAALSYGTAIAMREVAREEVPAMTMTMGDVSETRNETREDLRDAKVDQAIDAAEAAIVGRVVSVEALPWQKRVTEHDALWTDAVIEVTNWLKGGEAQQIVIQFPASYDVAWFSVPKLTAGMERTFLLHEGALPSATSTVANLKRFKIVSLADVLPVSDADTVKRLLNEQ
jgi:hypothetical protein